MSAINQNEGTPRAVQAVYLLAGLEAAAVAVFAVLGMVTSSQKGAAVPITVFFLIVAASLAVGISALRRRRRSGRSLILVWQLFAVIIGVQTMLGGAVAGGLVTTAIGGVLILLLFSPAVASFLESDV